MLLLVFPILVKAQLAAPVEGEKAMSIGLKPSFTVSIKDLKAKKAADLFEDFIKQYKGKTKYNKKMTEYFTDNAQIYYVAGAADVDVYTRVSEMGSSVDVSCFFIVNEVFVNSKNNADIAKNAMEFMRLYAVSAERYKVSEKLEDEQKNMKKIESELKRLVHENEGFHKNIEDYKAKIVKAEADIVTNQSAQDNANKSIVDQAKVVESVKVALDALK